MSLKSMSILVERGLSICAGNLARVGSQREAVHKLEHVSILLLICSLKPLCI